jgi:cyclopropane fatty-acyl-phospholipid synthase-like methyltransferase
MPHDKTGSVGFRKIASLVKSTMKHALSGRGRHLYDAPNDYYAMWLDPLMVYSCAWFERGDEDLATAQLQKIDRVLTKIDLKPGHRLLDVDCGWGALVIRAAEKFGARCVGVTRSKNQFDWANECVKAAGLTDRVEIRLQARPDVEGRFDRITNLGMLGYDDRSDLPEYVEALHERLTPEGVLISHCVMSARPVGRRSRYDRGEFFGSYALADDEPPDLGYALTAMHDGGLEVSCIQDLRRHCVRTLRLWEANFRAKELALRQLVDEQHFRAWCDHLSDWATAFELDDVSIYEIISRKVGMHASSLPWPREAG